MLGIVEPQWYKDLQENKMMAFAMTFMVNAMANSMTATGAFEVYLNGE